MPGTNKREAAYTQARSELMKRLLESGALDLDEHERGELVRGFVRELEREHPELDDQMGRRLIGEGMQRNWGEARTSELASEGFEREGGEGGPARGGERQAGEGREGGTVESRQGSTAEDRERE